MYEAPAGPAASAAAPWLALALAAALASAAGPSAGQVKTFCSEPVTPFCVNRPATFEDKAATERCRQDLRTYLEGLDRYVECLSEQQREAQGRAQEMETRFECMARGEQNCR